MHVELQVEVVSLEMLRWSELKWCTVWLAWLCVCMAQFNATAASDLTAEARWCSSIATCYIWSSWVYHYGEKGRWKPVSFKAFLIFLSRCVCVTAWVTCSELQVIALLGRSYCEIYSFRVVVRESPFVCITVWLILIRCVLSTNRR